MALLCWEPWMHNPKLTHRLHRITAPTLFVRGASDGLVSADYLAAYAKLTPKPCTPATRRRSSAAFRQSRVLSFLSA